MRKIDKVIRLVGNDFATRPLFCHVEGEAYVAKWHKGDDLHYPLINEFIGYEICKSIGIGLPDHEFVKISEEGVASNETDLKLEIGDIFFVSKQVAKIVPLRSGKQLENVKPIEILKMIFVDVLLCNRDRNPGNLLLKILPDSSVITYPIDFSHAFYKACLWSDGQFKFIIEDPSCLEDLNQYLDHMLYRIIFSTISFSNDMIVNVGNEIKALIQSVNLDDIFSRIPIELSTLCSQSDLDLFNQFLQSRFDQIDEITDQIIRYINQPLNT